MARRPALEEFAARHGLKIVSVADIAEYRRQSRGAVRRAVEVDLPTEHGEFTLVAYERPGDAQPDLAIIAGDPEGAEAPLVRLHSECLTGDALGSLRCDCGGQLDRALRLIAQEGRGVVVYLRQEGRGIGLLNKLHAYRLQEGGLDTVEANEHLGFRADERDYEVAALILRDLGVRQVRLLTNNLEKVAGLEERGVRVVERLPLIIKPHAQNAAYMDTKRTRLGHLIDPLTDTRSLVG